MYHRIKNSGLPRRLCLSEAARRAFAALPAAEKESFTAAFSAVRRGTGDAASAESDTFRQNAQNPYGFFY